MMKEKRKKSNGACMDNTPPNESRTERRTVLIQYLNKTAAVWEGLSRDQRRIAIEPVPGVGGSQTNDYVQQ